MRLVMFVTPIDSTTVTTVASPSGMAATAEGHGDHEGLQHDLQHVVKRKQLTPRHKEIEHEDENAYSEDEL